MRSNERNFIKRLKARKEDALEFVIDTYLPFVKSIVHPILAPLNRPGMIEECTNDIFLSVQEHANTFRGKDAQSFKNWLGAISRFQAIDYYRKILNRTEFATEIVEVPGHNLVEAEIIELENHEELLTFIRQLPPLDQKILVMKFFLDFSSEEIPDNWI